MTTTEHEEGQCEYHFAMIKALRERVEKLEERVADLGEQGRKHHHLLEKVGDMLMMISRIVKERVTGADILRLYEEAAIDKAKAPASPSVPTDKLD